MAGWCALSQTFFFFSQQVSLALKAKAVFEEFGVDAEIVNADRRNIFDIAEGKALPLASWGGIALLIYQRDNRPILITPRYASIICLCQADQACANQAPGLSQPNQQPIDYSSYLSHCMRRDTGGNRANGRGLKVTLFTSPMTGQYI